MDSYCKFYEFIKPKLNPDPKYHLPFNPEEDKEKLILFRYQDSNKFVENLSDEEMMDYLNKINLFNFSFYRHSFYLLGRVYSKLSLEEKKTFKLLIAPLSRRPNTILSSLQNDFEEKLRIKNKIALMHEKFSKLDANNPSEVSGLIDDFFTDEPFKKEIFRLLEEKISEYYDISNSETISSIIDFCKKDFDGIISIFDLAMIFNPKVNIYFDLQKYKEMKTYIDKVVEESIYLKNIFYKVNNRKKDSNYIEFKANYITKQIRGDRVDNHPVLTEFNNLDTILHQLEFDYNNRRVKYDYYQFRNHIIYLFIKLRSILGMSKRQNLIKIITKEMKNSISLDNNYSNLERINLKEYLDHLLTLLLEGKEEEIPTLIDNMKRNKDSIIKLFKMNKENIINSLYSSLEKLGMTRSSEIFNNLKQYFNINIDELIVDIITRLNTDEELEQNIKNKIKLLIKITSYLNKGIQFFKSK